MPRFRQKLQARQPAERNGVSASVGRDNEIEREDTCEEGRNTEGKWEMMVDRTSVGSRLPREVFHPSAF